LDNTKLGESNVQNELVVPVRIVIAVVAEITVHGFWGRDGVCQIVENFGEETPCVAEFARLIWALPFLTGSWGK